ncbi:PAS domain S-box protein [Echinicola sp. 20G]|uniref:PAS domain S-box protein n=1 Tax=Echinicola sp. 20G TaxID=2781961 RepID=UPI001910D511|nr:PAS domain S-box protein [Echinicola sp. 20G]
MIAFNSKQFDNIFPFYILIEKDLTISSMGKSLKKLYPEMLHHSFTDKFQLKNPVKTCTLFSEFSELTNQLIILTNLDDRLFDLRGQFEVLSSTHQLLFMGSPWFKSIEELTEKSLNLYDFASHDPLFDLLHSLKNQEIITQDLKQVLKTVSQQKNELKKADKEIKETALFPMQNPDPLLRIDLSGKILLANPQATRLNSYFYKDRVYAHTEFWRTISVELKLNDEKQYFEVEADEKTYSFIVIPIASNQYFNIYGRDITEERINEKQIKLLSKVASSNKNGVLFTKPDGTIYWTNQGYSDLCGYASTDLLGKTPLEIGFGPSTNRLKVKQMVDAFKKGKSFDIELIHYKSNGDFFWARALGQPVHDQSGQLSQYFTMIEDISEEKAKAQELLDTKNKLKSIFEEMSDVVWSHNIKGKELTFITPSVKKLFQMDSTSIKDYDWWKKHIFKEDIEVLKKIKWSLMHKGNFTEKYRIVTKKGSIKWVSHNGKTINDAEDKPVRTDHIIRDITASVDADLALKKEVELQNILIDISSKYINIELEQVDEAIQNSLGVLGEFVQADRAYIFDYDFNKETTSNTFEWCREGISPEIKNLQKIPLSFFPQWVEKHAKGEPFYVPDVKHLPQEGPNCLREILEQQDIKSLITLPMIRNHKLLGFVGFDAVRTKHQFEEKERKLLFLFTQMILNITERKTSEKHLKRQEEKYRNIITNMNLGILEVAPNEEILYANKRFCDMSGYSLDELHGGKATDLLLESDGHKLLLEKQGLRKQGISDNFEISVKNKAGEKKWWFVSGSPNYNDEGELIGSLGIHLDITSQKSLEQELIQAKEDAEASTRAKELFLANMSHEIRTPMNAITGMINQLRKTVLDSDQTFYLNTINSAADNLLIIINDILDLSKIEAGKLSLEEIGFELESVLTRVMQVMSHKAEEKGLKFTNTIFDSDISNVLIGDPYRLNQILLNLISNAIKFTEKGGVDISCMLVEELESFQQIKIRVTDSGIGMEKEFVQNLFNKFNQEDTSITRKFGGTGLGMSICKELIELMHGKIFVSSTKDKGTTVEIELPLAKGSQEDLPKISASSIDTKVLKDKLILVTDDNDMNRLVASTILRNYGAKILEADNGIKAVDQVDKHPVDLILMDVQMPMLDGIQATQILRKKGINDTPIIALTAFALKGDDVKFLSQGMNDYLAKPFDEHQLLEIVSKWLKTKPNNKVANLSFNSSEIPHQQTKLFDLTKLKALSPGNKEFQQKMIDLFKTLSMTSINEIKEAFDKDDIEQVKKIAHRMKPSVSSMGIVAIQQEIKNLEEGKLTHEDMKSSILKIDKIILEVNEDLKNIQL